MVEWEIWISQCMQLWSFSVRNGGILPLWQHESRKFCIQDLALIGGFKKILTTGEDTEKHQKSSAHEIMNFEIFNLSRA